jgi:catechol 2,3-dioxygenase-like lactoylglutathione lyase family enzyme
MKLAAVRLFVRNLAMAQDFYGRHLGLKQTVVDPHSAYAVFDIDGVDVVIEVVAPEAPVDDQRLVGRFTGLSFSVSDIQADHQRLSQAGVSFVGPPERQDWGGWLATLRDPSGNELQLVQYPPAT